MKGKNPETWRRPIGDGDFCFTTTIGESDVTGALGQEGAVGEVCQHESRRPSVVESGSRDADLATPTPAKLCPAIMTGPRRKPFSYEKVKYLCSWPCCPMDFTTRRELLKHMTDLHKVRL